MFVVVFDVVVVVVDVVVVVFDLIVLLKWCQKDSTTQKFFSGTKYGQSKLKFQILFALNSFLLIFLSFFFSGLPC